MSPKLQKKKKIIYINDCVLKLLFNDHNTSGSIETLIVFFINLNKFIGT